MLNISNKMNLNQIRHISFLIFTLLVGIISAQAASVKLSVSPASGRGGIGVGDMFHVTYTITNLDATPSEPTQIPGGNVIFFTQTSSSSSVTIINGKRSGESRNVYTATVRATKEGTFSFGPISVGGVKSNKISYTIGKKSTKDSQSNNNDDPNVAARASAQSGPRFIGKGDASLFMRASVSKTRAYEQEALVYTVKLYSASTRISFVGATAAPKFEGFVIEESQSRDAQLRMESYNGKTYATAIIAKYIIFPQMKGKLNIIGNKYTVSVDQASFYDDPFFGKMTVGQPIQVSVAPNDLSIEVLPLPEPKPADFSGGVGKFSLSASIPQKTLKTNEPASIEYTVKGSGNLKYISLPDLNVLFPGQIEVYSPETDVKAQVSGNTVSGSVKFDYSIMPVAEGEYTIPDVTLVYFNPETGKYEKSVAIGFKVSVGKGSSSAKSQQRKNAKLDSSLMKVGPLSKEHYLYIYSFPYWLCFILPIILIIVAIIIWHKRMKDNADIVSFLSRKAGKIAAKRLKKARSCINSNRSEQFYDEMLAAMWGYLGDKLKMPISELTRDNIKDVLSKANLSDNDIDSIITLLDECEFAKYSSNSGSQSMSNVYNSGGSIINSLEQFFKKSQAMKSDVKNSGTVVSIILLLLTLSFTAKAQDNEVVIADSAYMQQDYTEAIEIYNDVINKYGDNAQILFNLGNAYVKNDDFGRAMLCFERARKLDPKNEIIKGNIDWLSNKVYDKNRIEIKDGHINLEETSLSFFQDIHRVIAIDSTSNSWAIFAAISFVLAIGFIALYIFSRNVLMKKTGFFSGGIFMFFSIIFLVFAALAANSLNSDDKGVVTAFKTELLSEPNENSKPSTSPLHRGTRLQVIETLGDSGKHTKWYKVRLNESVNGWIEQQNFELI